MADLSERKISADTLEACRRGDRDAFRAVYECYKDRVYSISLHFFHGDAAMASDVTQQVFLKLMTSLGQFRGDAELSTWLYRLVVNACLDASRRRKSEVLVEPDESAASSLNGIRARRRTSISPAALIHAGWTRI